jgi:ribosome maturation factor RimP
LPGRAEFIRLVSYAVYGRLLYGVICLKLKDQIAEIIRAPIETEGYDLIELKLSHFRKGSRLQVFIDSDHGINLNDCAFISRLIGPVIEKQGFLAAGFSLEVSSPGLDRPLHTFKDFRRRIGERVEIFFNDAERNPVTGNLIAVEGGHIELQTENDTRKLDLIDVRMGKILF